MNVPPVVVSTAGVSIEDVHRVAIDGAPVAIAEDVWRRVQAGRDVVEWVLERGAPVYGLTTGGGFLRNEIVDPIALLRYQRRTMTETWGGVGRALPDEDVRAIMLARVAGMARGGSGAHPDAMRTLVAMLNAGVHPVVPEVGSIGAADLMHMGTIARVMLGHGQARFGGETLLAAEALRRADIAPYELQPKDAFALFSANGYSIGVGALAVLEAERTAALADTAGALMLEAIGGNTSPFEQEVAAAKPFPGQIAAAAHVRELLADSYLHDPRRAVSVQDPLSFRVIPQVHGALREQIAYARRSVEIELNAMDDNPLVAIDSDRMLSNGNFHPMVLALAFDTLRVALAHAGMLSERRMNKSPERYPTSEAFAASVVDSPDAAGRARAGPLTFTAAAVVSLLKHAAAPVSLECPPVELDVEDHATLAPLAVMLTRQALVQLETLLAIEALVAVDALDHMSALPRLGAGTRAAYEAVQGAWCEAGTDAPSPAIVEAVRLALVRRMQ